MGSQMRGPKGKKIGRAKTRPSDLIRALLKSGMSHRNIAKTLNISHGSVSLEKESFFLAEEKQAKLKAEQSAENSSPPAPQENAASVEVLK